VSYRTGGLHDAGRVEKIAVKLSADIDIAPITADRTLSDMVASGEIDAIYSPRTPQRFLDGDPAVGRLFADFRAAEVEYFQATGIFPIMHVIALRREVYQRNRWIARSLVKAFEQARRIAFAGMESTAALRYSLPWLVAEAGQTRAVMGDDFWTYGLDDRNRATPTAFLRYSHSQGLADRAYEPEDLFAPESLDAVRI
jgi:4,5-dihydroxyphthalate decarboxylase